MITYRISDQERACASDLDPGSAESANVDVHCTSTSVIMYRDHQMKHCLQYAPTIVQEGNILHSCCYVFSVVSRSNSGGRNNTFPSASVPKNFLIFYSR